MNVETHETLHKLCALYPNSLFGNPELVRPLAAGTLDEFLKRHGREFGEGNLKYCIFAYKTSRHYFKAVAAGRVAIDLSGFATAPPDLEEQAAAREWLTRWSIRNCCDALRRPGLDKSQANNIIRILESDYRELKALSALAARKANKQLAALKLRRQMVEVAEALAFVDTRRQRKRTVEYARYYRAVSGCSAAELKGHFAAASTFATAAAKAAKNFRDSPRFFPSFFVDETDIGTRNIYHVAVAAFRDGQFGSAGEHFERWLTLNRHRHGRGDPTYDCNLFHKQICIALDALSRDQAAIVDWNELEGLLRAKSLSIYRTTRALWDHIEPLKALALQASRYDSIKPIVFELLSKARNEWRLLFIGAPLTGSDRGAGLEESVRLPEFLDVSLAVNELSESWRYLLQQGLRNSFIVKADYEARLLEKTGRPGSDTLIKSKPSYELESMLDKDLVAYTKALVLRNEPAKKHIFEKSEALWWEARAAARAADKATALTKYHRFFEVLRSLPHVLRVKAVDLIPPLNPVVASYATRTRIQARRMWRFPQRELVIECATNLPVGVYAYMRPRWNRSLKAHFRIKEGCFEPLFQSRVPEWMILFEKWASGAGIVPGEQFLRWCAQIDPQWLSVPLRLLTKLDFFSENEVRELWKNIYRRSIPAAAKGTHTVYTGLGYHAKSGSHQLYTVKQALLDLPGSERDFDFERAFRSLDSLHEEELGIESVVFIDDFVGSGEQAIKFFRTLEKTHPWIMKRHIILCAIAGFESGATEIRSYLHKNSARVILGKTLVENDRAFSPDNTLWDSETDRLRAQSFCENIGRALLPAEDSTLGWKGSQALVAFHHNIPNNTLPIFWARGIVNGKEWHPLFARF